MKGIIKNNLDKCVGCTRCLRVCPIDEANIARENGNDVIVLVESQKCIACGACLAACHHGSRDYEDDTERFFNDLKSGVPISMFAAPAVRTNFKDYKRLISWLRKLGVKKVYDASMGADICTWAHIRYIQRNGPNPIISQPCPVVVNYVLMYRNEIVKHLSPIHSPMLCTAIYMNKYEKINTKIAALSPCIAKSYEFGATNLVDYNVTFKNLVEYIERNGVVFPNNEGVFDNYESGLGTLYPMPGGLKECVEHYVGKSFRIDRSEGPGVVYKALDEYSHKDKAKLPVLFDVLNCTEGCNMGTGCAKNGMDIFDINTVMNNSRKGILDRDRVKFVDLDGIFKEFDKNLKLNDFIRRYMPVPVKTISYKEEDIEAAFVKMGKNSEGDRIFDCGACGYDSCREMAIKVAKGIEIPSNCIQKSHHDIMEEHKIIKDNLENFKEMLNDISNIKDITGDIVINVEQITNVISAYDKMIVDIEKIAMSVNIISLNASIEAARAGSHGKAFGVVAEEIRKLAKDSDDSAKLTKQASVKAGEAVASIKSKVNDISGNVNDTYDRMAAISLEASKTMTDL